MKLVGVYNTGNTLYHCTVGTNNSVRLIVDFSVKVANVLSNQFYFSYSQLAGSNGTDGPLKRKGELNPLLADYRSQVFNPSLSSTPSSWIPASATRPPHMSQFKRPLPTSGSPLFCGDNKRFRDLPSEDAMDSPPEQAPSLSTRDSKADIKLIYSNSTKGKPRERTVDASSSSSSSISDQLKKEEVAKKTPPIVSEGEVASETARRLRQAQQKQLKEQWRKQFVEGGEGKRSKVAIGCVDKGLKDDELELLSNGKPFSLSLM